MKTEIINNKCWKTIGVFGDKTCEKLQEYSHCRHCLDFSQARRLLFSRVATDDLVEEWTRSISEIKQVEDKDFSSVLIFTLGDEQLAISTMIFEQAVKLRHIHSIPYRTNKVFLGLSNINGELVLCISLSELLSIQKQENVQDKGRLLVIKRENFRYAFEVDFVTEITRIPISNMSKPPSTISESKINFSQGIFSYNGKQIGLIDENLLFDTLARTIKW